MPTPQNRTAVILTTLCLAEFVVVMDNTIVNVALPTIAQSFGAKTDHLQWTADAYTLTFAALLLPMGRIADRIGRRRLLTCGLVAFAMISALTALAGTVPWLIGCRATLGVSAAMVYPATLSLLTAQFRGSRTESLAIGIWAATSGLGVALGPVLGGLLLEHFTWSSVFWINVPISLALAAICPAVLVESKSTKRLAADPVGAIGALLAVSVLTWSIIEAPDWGWASTRTFEMIGLGLGLCLLVLLWARHRPDGLLDLELLTKPAFAASAFAISASYFALFGFIFAITLYFQGVLGYSALLAGAATLPFALVMAALSPLATGLSRKFSPRTVIGIGLVLMGLGYGLVSFGDLTSPYWRLTLPAMVLMAAGLALVQGPATSTLMAQASLDRASSASAINDTTREVGGTLGVAVIGSALASRYRHLVDQSAALSTLPGPVAETVRGSVVGADSVARSLPAAAGEPLNSAAHQAFVSALQLASGIAAAAALVSAVIFLAVFRNPNRVSSHQPGSLSDAEAMASGS